jgi:hypothetical protein
MTTDVNNLCNLKFLLKPSNFNEKELVDVVSTSLFKMEKGYKYFEKYMRGLEMAVNNFSKKLPDLKFLLFIDDSIFKEPILFNRIKKMNNGKLIVMHYSCTIGLQTGSLSHIELFGTMVRFLPFFKYDTNFTRQVICIDADIDPTDLDYLVINYEIFQKTKSQYQYDTNMFYELLAKWSLVDDYTILAGRQMCKYKFPLSLLIDYIDCVKNQTCKDMAIIKSFMDYQKYHVFPYGIDEFFLNHILLPFMKKHKITYSASIRYAITAPLYYLNCQNAIPINSPTGKFLYQKLKWILTDSSIGFLGKNRTGLSGSTKSSYNINTDQINYMGSFRNQRPSCAELLHQMPESANDNSKVSTISGTFEVSSTKDDTKDNYKKLIDQFDQIFYPYIYNNRNNPSDYDKLVAHKYYDFILELWKTENYDIFPNFTLKKILNARDYISKHNLIIYYGSGKVKKYLFPNCIKI